MNKELITQLAQALLTELMHSKLDMTFNEVLEHTIDSSYDDLENEFCRLLNLKK